MHPFRASVNAIVVSFVIIALVLSAFSMPAKAAATEDLSGEIATEGGSTDLLGGGDHFFIKFGSDAAFGIVWGNESHSNNIYVVTVMSRYLGLVDVYNSSGSILSKDHVAKIYTIYAVKLDSILEFRDGTGDGVVRYFRTYNETTGEYSDYVALRPYVEPIYKRVDLDTKWAASNITMSDTGGSRSWSFSLTATNLTYEAIKSDTNTSVGDGVLNSLTLTFTLNATTTHYDEMSVPLYNVTMNGGSCNKVESGGDQTVSGNVTSYHVKWGKEITGWDFDPRNDHPALLMEYGSIIGNFIPAAERTIMAAAQYQKMMALMNEDGTVSVNNGGSSAYNGTASHLALLKQALTSPRLTFGGERTRIGSFSWAENATVDGQNVESRSEISAIYPVQAFTYRGMSFSGFIAMTGISFPGGNEIVQDPEVSSEAVTDVSLGSSETINPVGNTSHGSLLGPVVVVIVLVIVSVAIVGAILKKMSARPGKYDQKDVQKPDDWSKYLEKK